MFRIYYIILVFIFLLLSTCQGQEELSDLYFLVGIWQIEGKQSFESWIKINGSEYSGEVYILKNASKQTTETLSIKSQNGKVIYEATVKNQNDGKPISFALDTSNKELFSFENLKHDFPKKFNIKKLQGPNYSLMYLMKMTKGILISL